MSVAIACPCGKTLNVKAEMAGKKIRCPDCQSVHKVVLEPASTVQDSKGATGAEKKARRKQRKQGTDSGQGNGRLWIYLAAGGGAILLLVVGVSLVSYLVLSKLNFRPGAFSGSGSSQDAVRAHLKKEMLPEGVEIEEVRWYPAYQNTKAFQHTELGEGGAARGQKNFAAGEANAVGLAFRLRVPPNYSPQTPRDVQRLDDLKILSGRAGGDTYAVVFLVSKKGDYVSPMSSHAMWEQQIKRDPGSGWVLVPSDVNPASNSAVDQAIQALEAADVKVTRDEFQPNQPVIRVLFGKRQPTRELLKHVKEFNLSELAFANTTLTPDALQALGELTSLRRLSLDNVVMTDEGFRHLKGLTKLEFLFLNKTRVTLAGLKELTNLKELWASDTAVNDAGLKELSGMKQLRVLMLSRTAVTDEGLAAISDLPALTQLELHGTGIHGDGLSRMRNLPALQELNLGLTKVNDEDLKALPNFPQLRKLDLGFTAVNGSGLAALANMKHLEEIILDRAPVTDAGLAGAGRVSSLKRIDLSNTTVTDTGLNHLRDLRNLQEIKAFNTRISSKGVKDFKGSQPRVLITGAF